MVANRGREDRVSAIDGILDIAQHMREADLVAAAQFLLPAIAVRYPDIGAMIAQHRLGDTARPARSNLVQHGRVGDEHPLPLGDTVRPGGRFVRSNDPGGAQPLADRASSGDHVLPDPAKDVGDGTFGDGQAEHFGREPRQALEADVMAVVEVSQQ